MSFLTDPDLYGYAVAPDICNACYDVNKSPKTLLVALTGIQIGQAWTPADPPPPNGVWELTANGVCRWTLADVYNFVLAVDAPGATMRATTAPPAVIAFNNVPLAACSGVFTSLLTDIPANKFFGGNASVVLPLPGGADSVQEIMESLAMDPFSQHWNNPRSTDDDQTVYNIASHLNRTNIKIKVL